VDDGGDDISTFRAIVYSLTSALPPGEELTRENGAAVFDSSGTELATGRGSFTITVPGDPGTGTAYLEPGLEYVFRAFAVNASGISYTDSTVFAMPVSVPVLNSPPTRTSVTATTATLGGVVASDGGSVILSRGFLYSTDPAKLSFPLTSNVIDTDPIDNGRLPLTYTKPIAGLTPNTTYFFRSYAKNSVGYGYSQVSSFKTAAAIPLPGESSVQWVPLPSSEPVAKMPLPGAQPTALPLVPMFVYDKHPLSMEAFVDYEVQFSADALEWQSAESAGWLVTGVNDPSATQITATWTSADSPPDKAFFRVKALPVSVE
jgi:hypothetical protein